MHALPKEARHRTTKLRQRERTDIRESPAIDSRELNASRAQPRWSRAAEVLREERVERREHLEARVRLGEPVVLAVELDQLHVLACVAQRALHGPALAEEHDG